ncbi:MAG: hypothetical protein A3F70_09635 [Acidobacteria bacterium RIFCSPLOWO2_12_FULL_67_14]|nr:MAG: hypothetical protein A3H29_09840 [Acidobacteria bacterium RIFCSPLOWO2_02_FULL_67_21]OFW38289.1 MAG: hypothetical protein A3F70_09635 [Acidobacteria bacterium RIFCSPLOWO2_12_FULL_67_14]
MSTADLVAAAVLLLGTGAAVVIDLRTRRVPNPLTLALGAAGVALAATGVGRVGVGGALLAGALGLLLMLPGHLMGATGGGDVKLFAAVGTLLGPGHTVRAFVFTLMAGALLALAVALARGQLGAAVRRTGRLLSSRAGAGEIRQAGTVNRFAYAPAIAAGAMAALVLP